MKPAASTTATRERRRARGGWLAALSLALVACGGADVVPTEPVPEPTEALRPLEIRGPIPEAAHVVDYALEARYEEEDHRIDGRARITWRNRGPGPVAQIPFHLYMNGFRAEDTAWMRQARGSHRGQEQDREAPWGYIDVASVERLVGGEGSDGEPARATLRFEEQPEPSLMTVWLDEPVPPGGTLQLDLAFTTRLPRVFARTGFSERYVMAGQWFPKPGVLEPDGTWRTHPFTLYSEFYADFGDYDVTLDLPGDLVVGASGIRLSHETEGTRQRLRYRAQMVHDFAWTAGPDMVEAWDDYEGIRVRLLLPQDAAEQAGDHLEAQRQALASMEARFGPYPWSTITAVLPPEGAGGAGGMEYPTFYTTSPARPMPAWLRALGFDFRVGGRFTTIHEFGHQYFQGLLASNEFAQPWLDEGLNTFSNMLVYVDSYGDDAGGPGSGPWLVRLAGHPVSLYDGLRYEQSHEGMQPVDQSADRFTPLVGVYGSVTYRKTAALMFTLRRVVGEQAFDAAMRAYTMRHRFGHPTGDDLEAAFVEQLGERVTLGHTAAGEPITLSLPQYFEQALRGTAAVDFRVHTLRNRPALGDAGWRRDEHGALVGGEPPPEPSDRGESREAGDDEAVVVVHRRGDFVIPVEIEVELDEGERERVLWDGTGRYRVLRWPGRRVRWVSIDPEGRLVLERRRYDNTRYADDRSPPIHTSAALDHLGEASALALAGALGP